MASLAGTEVAANAVASLGAVSDRLELQRHVHEELAARHDVTIVAASGLWGSSESILIPKPNILNPRLAISLACFSNSGI